MEIHFNFFSFSAMNSTSDEKEKNKLEICQDKLNLSFHKNLHHSWMMQHPIKHTLVQLFLLQVPKFKQRCKIHKLTFAKNLRFGIKQFYGPNKVINQPYSIFFPTLVSYTIHPIILLPN